MKLFEKKTVVIFALLFFSFSSQAVQEVSFDLAKKAAEQFSSKVFGEASVGLPQLYFGIDGKPAAYVFTVCLSREIFPSEKDILDSIARGSAIEIEGVKTRDSELIRIGRELKLGSGNFGSIMVSATYDKGPVIAYSHGLPSHYTARMGALKKAAEAYGSSEFTISRLIYYSPLDLWFEMSRNGAEKMISMFDSRIYDPNRILSASPLRIDERLIESVAHDWENVAAGNMFEKAGNDSVRISGVPDLDWSYGCSPTASTMILSYWDTHGYSALVDYYFDRWDGIEGEMDYDVPNIQQQLAIAMQTDTVASGGTDIDNIVTGTQAVCNDPQWNNNYNFTCTDAGDNRNRLINELNNGRPVHLVLLGHPTYENHSVCAMGWGPPDTMYVRIHDTWSSTPEDVIIHYNNWGGVRHVITVKPPAYVGGDITTNTVWEKARSPFIVTSDIRVSNNATLTIEPGVVVKFNNGTGMVISQTEYPYTGGLLLANGTVTDSVYFTSYSGSAGGWKGIVFDDRSDDIGTCYLSYCVVEKAGESNKYGVGVNLYSRGNTAGLSISNSSIRNSSGYEVFSTGASPIISNTRISGSSSLDAIHLANSSPSLTQSIISGSGGSYWLYSEDGNCNPQITGCSFSGSITRAIRVGCMTLMNGNNFSGNSMPGIELIGGTITSNMLWKKQSGYGFYRITINDLKVYNNATLTIEPGVVVKFNNGTGMVISQTEYPYSGGLLLANGTVTDSVYFTSYSGSAGGWKGIVFDDRSDDIGTCNLSYCVVEKSGESNKYGVGVNLYSRGNTAGLSISNSSIRNSSGYGIYCSQASPRILKSKIVNNLNYGFYNTAGSKPIIGGALGNTCYLFGNGTYDIYNSGGTADSINARYNFWGSADSLVIASRIYDYYDNSVSGKVLFKPYIDSILIQKDDFVGTWTGQGVYYRNSDSATWVKLGSPADLIATGDLDNDGTDDLIGIWPGQGGVWVKYSATGSWVKLASTARHIACGDMNGDGRVDLVGTWDGQGVYYCNSVSGTWVQMGSPATLITTGDLDGDGTDDLIGVWPSQGGVWVKYSHNSAWTQLSSTAVDITTGDMNGDGRVDFVGTWSGQGVYYLNSVSGAWVKLGSPATQVTAGDLDGDETDDLIGIWPGQGGVWVMYSKTGKWAQLSSTAIDIATGKMRGGATPDIGSGPVLTNGNADESEKGPGGTAFKPIAEADTIPR
jgi:hypothetical protein